MEKALALSTFFHCYLSWTRFLQTLNSKFSKILAASWHAPAQRNNKKKMPSSSRNTSDSWVKKATGLSPGSMAPLSSAVNAAASAYGVGVLVFFGRSFPRKRERLLFASGKKQRTHFLAVAIFEILRCGGSRRCCHHIAHAGKRRERERDVSLSICARIAFVSDQNRTRFLSSPDDMYYISRSLFCICLLFLHFSLPFLKGRVLWVLCASD